MDDERTNSGDGVGIVGSTADVTKMGAGARHLIESLGGVPALDDKTMGVLAAVQHARNFQYYINSRVAFLRVQRRTHATIKG